MTENETKIDGRRTRGVNTRARVAAAVAALTQRYRRAPTVLEIAAEAAVSVRTVFTVRAEVGGPRAMFDRALDDAGVAAEAARLRALGDRDLVAAVMMGELRR